jgi:hypothetical protein
MGIKPTGNNRAPSERIAGALVRTRYLNGDHHPPEIAFRKRSTIFWFTWFVLLLLATCVAPLMLFFILWFPLGLALLMNYHHYEVPVTVIGWLMYLILSIFILTSQTRMRFYILYGALLVLLALNVGGCYVAMKGACR